MKNYEIDMCHGPLFGKILLFALPLMLTYAIQLVFNAADLMVIGHYAHYNAMAAIGATMNYNSLVLNLFMGLSIGTNVVMARAVGAGEKEQIRRTVRTSMTVAFFGGILLMIAGLLTAKPLLILMKTPAEILPLSCEYIRICFLAIPFIMLYNFGCAVLRAVGDTRRPLFFLIVAGILNVILNLVLVIVFHLDVAGVAWATAGSHTLAAILILITLFRSKEIYGFRPSQMECRWPVLKEVLIIGVPAGLQSSCFAISNMLIQSSINSFGPLAMAGTTAAVGLEGIVYISSYSYHQTAISFVAQNLGGHHYKRILRCMWLCTLLAFVCSSIVGIGFWLTGKYVLRLFNPDPAVIEWGVLRLKVMFTTYGACGLMDAASGCLRGLGKSMLSTIISLCGACVFRIWWIYTIFPLNRTMENLLWSYPASWALTALIGWICVFIAYRKLLHSKCDIVPPWQGLKGLVPRGFRYLGGPK